MSDNDKPFACNIPGCGQTFTNNDRLVVHRQTHSLSLKIGKKIEDNIPDQTPTPTRFIKNCDEDGLFEELGDNENPFDRDFKSATGPSVEQKIHAVETVVNTPVPAALHSDSENDKKDAVVFESNDIPDGEVVESDISAPPAIQTVVIDGTLPNAAEFLIQASQATVQGSNIKGEPISSPKVSVLVARNSGVPKAIPAFIAHPANPVPKATPAPQVVSAVQLSIPTPAIVVSPTAGNNKQGSFIKSAKQKLKETLRYHQSQGKDVRSNMGNIITQAMDEAVTSYKRRSSSNDFQEDEDIVEEKKPVKRGRKSQEDLSADEKRERFLERNRAAATRCREKRKMWIQALEKKAEEMSELNSQLQNEISCLKHEVAELKALLLAHRDCPLTLTQQKMNPGLFDQLSNDNRRIITITDIPSDQQSAEATATTALTQMAQRATMELETISNGS